MENCNIGFIEDIEWGKIQINKKVYIHDVIINKGVVSKWDWSIFKTNHKDGINVDELKAFLISSKFDVDKIVLSRGIDNKLNVSDDVYIFSKIRTDVEFFIGDTISAYKKYNQWINENNNVLAFFHLTC